MPTLRVSRTNKRLSIEVPARAFRKSIQIHACHDSTRISCRRFKVGSSGSRQIEAHLYVSRGDQGKSGRSLSFLFPGNDRPDLLAAAEPALPTPKPGQTHDSPSPFDAPIFSGCLSPVHPEIEICSLS